MYRSIPGRVALGCGTRPRALRSEAGRSSSCAALPQEQSERRLELAEKEPEQVLELMTQDAAEAQAAADQEARQTMVDLETIRKEVGRLSASLTPEREPVSHNPRAPCQQVARRRCFCIISHPDAGRCRSTIPCV